VNEKLREVRLYGRLGARFGRIHMLAVSSTGEAIRALCVLIPGFERALADSEAHGVRYACFIGKKNIGEEEMRQPVGSDSIRIAPVLAGSKRAGLFQTVLGAAMLVVGAITWQPWLMQMGAAIALGGVIQLLSPQQLGLSSQDNPGNGASYNFNGAVNTDAQGGPAPLLYGRHITGSATISAGIFAEDQV
jgi:predicted phage tail protein